MQSGLGLGWRGVVAYCISPAPAARVHCWFAVRAGEDMGRCLLAEEKGSPALSSSGAQGHKGDTGPLPARVSSQRLWARNGLGQDPTKKPRGGGRRPASETRSFMSPTGPRISTVSRGECELRAQCGVDRGSGPH